MGEDNELDAQILHALVEQGVAWCQGGPLLDAGYDEIVLGEVAADRLRELCLGIVWPKSDWRNATGRGPGVRRNTETETETA